MNVLHQLGMIFLTVLAASCSMGQEPARNGFPEFSWDRVPVSAHFGIGEGLTPEQYDFIADRFNFITLTAGPLPRSSKGSAELFTAEAARAIKKRNPKAKVLFYWASDKPKHQSKIANEAYPGEYILQTQKRNGQKDRTIKWFDLTRNDVQSWWSDAAADAVHKYGCDGIFVDGATAGAPEASLSRVVGKKKAANMDKAVFAMLKEAKRKMGAGKLIIFNPLHGFDGKRGQLGQEYLPVTDGAMVDDFDRARAQSKEYMANTIKTMRSAAKGGKVIIFKGWPRFLADWRAGKMKNKTHDEVLRAAQKEITFPLACFLVGAEPNCFFCYSWGWTAKDGALDWHEQFDMPLGPPKGDAVQKGWTFQREFKHASVYVDLESKVAKIAWKNTP